MKHSKPYLQGQKDYKSGKRWTQNPYKYGSKAHYDWETAMIDCMNNHFDKVIAKLKEEQEKSLTPK